MVIPKINEEAIDYATKRIEDFAVVQLVSDDKMQGLDLMFVSLGLGRDERKHFIAWKDRFAPEMEDDATLIGLLIGLFIHQYYQDHSDD